MLNEKWNKELKLVIAWEFESYLITFFKQYYLCHSYILLIPVIFSTLGVRQTN